MRALSVIAGVLFPPKCILCRRLLPDDQLDLCHSCRELAPEVHVFRRRIPYLAKWTSLWYYKDSVRHCLLRYKFRGRRSYAASFGRMLAMKLLQEEISFDILSWVPVSAKRKRRRGFDQSQELARYVGRELGMEPVSTLRKIRHNPPQSGMVDASARKANVLGAYRVIDPKAVAGKRILLLDDILTTGSTVGECARTLMSANAKEVFCATVAVAEHTR